MTKKTISRTGHLVVLALLFFMTAAVVSDFQDDPLPGVIVQLEEVSRGRTMTATTDSEGAFEFNNLATGDYLLTVPTIVEAQAPTDISAKKAGKPDKVFVEDHNSSRSNISNERAPRDTEVFRVDLILSREESPDPHTGIEITIAAKTGIVRGTVSSGEPTDSETRTAKKSVGRD